MPSCSKASSIWQNVLPQHQQQQHHVPTTAHVLLVQLHSLHSYNRTANEGSNRSIDAPAARLPRRCMPCTQQVPPIAVPVTTPSCPDQPRQVAVGATSMPEQRHHKVKLGGQGAVAAVLASVAVRMVYSSRPVAPLGGGDGHQKEREDLSGQGQQAPKGERI